MRPRRAAVVLWLALAAVPAFGQGCAMCWTGANAAGKKAQTALNRGIGVLMATTLSMIGGLAVLVIRNRNSGQETPIHEDTASSTASQ